DVDEDDAPYAFNPTDECHQDTDHATGLRSVAGNFTEDTTTEPYVDLQMTMEVDTPDAVTKRQGKRKKEIIQGGKRESRGTAKSAVRTSTSAKTAAPVIILRTPKPAIPKMDNKGGVQTSMKSFMHLTEGGSSSSRATPEPDSQPTTATQSKAEDYIPDTPDSQEDFTIGDTRTGTLEGDQDLPIQIGQWLASFNGKEVAVAANGHCSFLAVLATTINFEGATMENSAEVLTDATDLKWHTYTLMMANLRNDVELKLIDPIEECAKLHPEQEEYTTVSGATAALYAHYDAARRRSAGVRVQSSYWAGPHELRAIAQYLREPILVFDVNAAGDAHVQCYFYGKHRMGNGTDHESGYGQTMTDRHATEYLRTCWSLHVLPTFVILKHHERHFYGVGHGETFFKWKAEGDPDYTPNIAADFTWKRYINVLTEHESTSDLNTVNRLADISEVNSLLIKRCDMRERLDIVHARVGLPTLAKTDVAAAWEDTLLSEEQLLNSASGMDRYAASSQSEDDSSGATVSVPLRHARAATGDIMMTSYFRILRVGPEAPMDAVDAPLATLLAQANDKAFGTWCSLFRREFDIPPTKRRTKPADIRQWLLGNGHALRHYYAFIPHPEYEAKCWPLADIEEWGAFEVYNEQISALKRIVDDDKMPEHVRTFCEEWRTAATDASQHRETMQTLARAPQRWKRLAQWIPAEYGRAQPDLLTETEWRVLHILPYTHGDWSGATLVPSGQAWGEETEDSDQLTRAPRRN
ncbi:hypothetical protein PR003_g29043, partial [Phytophthora rubi]